MAVSPNLWRDDNGAPLTDGSGLRPRGLAANIVSATLTGSTQTLDVSTLTAAAKNTQNSTIVQVTTDSQGALYAFDAAGQAANYTSIANLVMLPPNTSRIVKVYSTDARCYVLQLGVGGNFQVCALE